MSTTVAPTNQRSIKITSNVAQPPKYLCPLHWDSRDNGISQLASISESLPPLPRVLSEELNNQIVTKTIQENQHLFSIVTPINTERFASLLTNHPNQPFVSSVLTGLQEGF
jgi:hypothetical protein